MMLFALTGQCGDSPVNTRLMIADHRLQSCMTTGALRIHWTVCLNDTMPMTGQTIGFRDVRLTMLFALTGQYGDCPCNTILMTADHRLQKCPTYDALHTHWTVW